MNYYLLIEYGSQYGIYDFFKDIVIPIIATIGGLASCWIAYKVYSESRKPNISLDYNITNDGKFNKNILYTYYEELSSDSQIGFCNGVENYNTYIKIKNLSDYPITNFILEYELDIRINEVETGIDLADIVSYKEKEYKKVIKKITIDYIPPNKEVNEWVFCSSRLPYCYINIISARSREKIFYSKKFLLVKYNIFDYILLGDGNHLMRVLGMMK